MLSWIELNILLYKYTMRSETSSYNLEKPLPKAQFLKVWKTAVRERTL
jgi:hypothetical protein